MAWIYCVQAPLLRKGGARTLRSNVWGDLRNARRVPSQINKKGHPKGSLFYLSGGERGIGSTRT